MVVQLAPGLVMRIPVKEIENAENDPSLGLTGTVSSGPLNFCASIPPKRIVPAEASRSLR